MATKVKLEEIDGIEMKTFPDMDLKKETIPEEIPKEKNNHIDDIMKRRSSLRRSINGSISSFRAICSSVDTSLPLTEKRLRIAELCLNRTLLDLKSNALEKEYDAVLLFSDKIREQMQNILLKVGNSSDGVGTKKRESKSSKHITQIKEERSLWNEEFHQRRQNYLDARNKLKDVTKRKIQIEATRLKAEDMKFLKGLPDFAAINEKIVSYKNRHAIGIIHLEKNTRRVYRSLAVVEQQLDEAKNIIAPPYQWSL